MGYQRLTLSALSYVLKNKDTGDVLFVVVFTLLKKDELDKEEVQNAEKNQRAAGEKIEKAVEGSGSKKDQTIGDDGTRADDVD